MITRSSSEEAGTQFFRVLMRCRIKKAVVGVTQLITALVSIYSSMTFLVDMYSFLDPPGRTVLLSVDDRSLFPVDCVIGLMRMVGECWLAIFRQTGCALKAVLSTYPQGRSSKRSKDDDTKILSLWVSRIFSYLHTNTTTVRYLFHDLLLRSYIYSTVFWDMVYIALCMCFALAACGKNL